MELTLYLSSSHSSYISLLNSSSFSTVFILPFHYSKIAIFQFPTASSLNETPAFKDPHHLFHYNHPLSPMCFLLFSKLVQHLLNLHRLLLLLRICSYCFLASDCPPIMVVNVHISPILEEKLPPYLHGTFFS